MKEASQVASYGQLAEIYDRIYRFKNYGKDVEYVLDQIRTHHPAARTLLDTACGTGNHVAILKQHYAVDGLDLSAEMLAIARRKFPAVTFHEASMTDFSLGRGFDVVTCLFRSIGYVRTAKNLVAAIGAMSRHVLPGGLLLVEPYFTPETYWADKVNLSESQEDDLKIAWMYVSARRDLLSVLEMHYLVGTPGGVRHFSETHELGLFSRDDFHRAFDAAGMSVTYDPVGPTNVGFYIARKPS
jgi:ubiquinone/menaquinone biosynthesis C-methylase UbiE